MKRLALGLAFALTAAAAWAALPPEYYQEARDKAPNVILVAVARVETPRADLGTCKVHGTVLAVERGGRYRSGEAVVIPVPCAEPWADVPSSGVVWQEMPNLKRSTRGRAFLDAEGGLALHQYDIDDLR